MANWYNNNWQYRAKITFDQTKVQAGNDNLYVDLANMPSGFWSHVKQDGGDVRMTKVNVAVVLTFWNDGVNTFVAGSRFNVS